MIISGSFHSSSQTSFFRALSMQHRTDDYANEIRRLADWIPQEKND
jgi:hypothetical protein